MPRNTFLYYPSVNDNQTPQTFYLDWNIATKINSLWNGNKFEGDPTTRARLLDLADRFSDKCRVVGGFSAAEPETRPDGQSVNIERLYSRTANIIAMLEQGSSLFPKFLDGVIDPKDVIHPYNGPKESDPLYGLDDMFIRPCYVVLMKAVILRAQENDVATRIRDYEFWLNHELKYRPSREIWLGMLLLAGNSNGLRLVSDILKLGKKRTPKERVRDVWGATWDIFYTRITDASADPSILPGHKRPFVFVTDDQRLYEAIKDIALVGFTPTHQGELGVDILEYDKYIDPLYLPHVHDAQNKIHQRMLTRKESNRHATTMAKSKARSEQRRLYVDLTKVIADTTI